MILVSACLIGLKCRYDAKICSNEEVVKFLENKDYWPICPEQMGGLSTPRDPAEILSTKPLKIVNSKGIDVTFKFVEGVDQIEKIIKNKNIKLAILKDKSPSCGCEYIYDGNFSKILIKGEGILTKRLRSLNIKVINEKKVGINE